MSIKDLLKAVQAGLISPQDAKLALHGQMGASPTQPPPEHAPQPEHESRSTEVPRSAMVHLTEPIAVVGLSGRYALAEDLEQFWTNLAEGRDCISDAFATRWDPAEFRALLPPQSNKIYCRWMGMLEGIEYFDPLFFNISPAEAETIDPQHRIFLEEAYRACEDAGYAGGGLSNIRCGVYFGVMGGEYSNLTMISRTSGSATGTSNAVGAARIAYYLNLKGPAMAIDTACSSSLVATHLACQALHSREVDLAISGGAALYLMPGSYVGMCAAGMLSPTGRCRTFDNGADGFVPGEGVGAVVLKRLSDAEADRDTIHGLIIGSGINQDGKTNGITAPSKRSQTDLEREVYARYHIDPDTITYVEMHGTGTKLGDPIELEALSTAWKERTARRQYCAIGSVKTNIGHTSAAAGVASIQKVLLAMRHKTLVPTIHFSAHNEHFDFAASPFYVNTQLRAWSSTSGTPRRAALSSFGFSGTNAHMVIEEYLAPRPRAVVTHSDQPALCLCSARNPERLRDSAERLLRCLEQRPELDLQDVAFTLQVGREAMEYRLAIVAGSKDGLRQSLQHFLGGDTDEAVITGRSDARDETVLQLQDDAGTAAMLRECFDKQEFTKLGTLWVRGLEITWSELRHDSEVQRVSLPAYPFDRVACWLSRDFEAGAAMKTKAALHSRLHPLLHHNTSNFSAQRFESTFSGDEFFLAGHQVAGRHVLPGVAYLELARAAVEISLGAQAAAGAAMRIDEVVWLRPLTASDDEGHSQAANLQITLLRGEGGDIAFEIRNGSEPDTLHCQGRASMGLTHEAPRVDLAALHSQLRGAQQLTGEEHYRLLQAMGLSYGEACRGLERITLGPDVALARLRLPATPSAQQSGFVLHPTLLDAAFQASLGLGLVGRAVESPEHIVPSLPFALASLELFGATESSMWAVVREGGSSLQLRRFDIDLCADDGRVCVRLSGLGCRPSRQGTAPVANQVEAGASLQVLVPRWEPVPTREPRLEHQAYSPGRTLVLGGDEQAWGVLSQLIPDAMALPAAFHTLRVGRTEAIAAHVRSLGVIDAVLWLSPPPGPSGEPNHSPIPAQQDGVLLCFDTIKALLSLDYWARPLTWTVVTRMTQAAVEEDRVDAGHASLRGLFGSMAKEYPNWQVRLVDLEAGSAWPLHEILALPPNPAGAMLAYRAKEWYRQQLLPLIETPLTSQPAYKKGGLYVVIGGAGGIGEVWSEWMIRHYRARIAWIGRRPLNEEIERKLKRLGALGARPLYVSADATDGEELARARHRIKEYYGAADSAISGVLHSAIVLLDKSLATMSRDQFEAGLRVKVDGSVHLAQVFGEEPLDFITFFSSMQSFSNEPGQSNYSAGCTFSDAYAYELSSRLPCKVKVMNWGYWGSVGIVANPAMRLRMAATGSASIEAEEGMAALDRLLRGPWPQLGLVKLSNPELIAEANAAPCITRLDITGAPDLGNIRTRIDCSIASRHFGPRQGNLLNEAAGRRAEAMEALMAGLLFVQLSGMGLFAGSRLAILEQKQRLDPMFDRWFNQSLRELQKHGYVQIVAGQLMVNRPAAGLDSWAAWEEAKAQWLHLPESQAQAQLVEATLHALPEILLGKRSVVDILFGGDAMDRVQGVYQGHSGADAFNTVVADVAFAYLEEHVAHAREQGRAPAPLRLLEIGAGTGATSAAVLTKLHPYRDFVDEYCFTDISRAFLIHAQEKYGPEYSCLVCKLFDVEQPLRRQDIDIGGFDLVIATNVLHATRDIRRTLRNAKAALREGGLLLLNEMNTPGSLFTHLTFGLTKGWWLFEDEALRVPGTPGLLPETWKRVLEGEGFHRVFFPAEEAHGLGQQVVVGRSDGVVRQERATRSASAQTTTANPQPDTAGNHAGTTTESAGTDSDNAATSENARTETKPPADDTSFRAQVREYLTRLISSVLKVGVQMIDPVKPLERYGLDSIIAVQMATALSKSLKQVGSMLFLEYPSVELLADHLIATRAADLRAILGIGETAEKVEASAPHTEASRPSAADIASGSQPAQPSTRLIPAFTRPSTDIAIVAVAGRYPGAYHVDDLWQVLAQGKDCVTEVPAARWDHALYFDADRRKFGKTYCRWGSFMDGVDEFDPLFFDITPASADALDPQVRLCLQTVWELLERSGYTRESLKRQHGSRVGVFLGAMYQQYSMVETDYVVNAGVALTSYSTITNRISSFFDFKGPSVAVDTQCSSSMIAVHMACRSLLDEECEVAIAGGINLLLHPKKYIGLSMGYALGSRRDSRTFNDGDGFIPSEGVGAVFLKPLARAVSDGDPIMAVIKYSGQSHGGHGIGYGSQNPNAQLELIETSLRRSHIHPRTISYVEAAANGTVLGDAIEASALIRSYRDSTQDKHFCAIGSVKSNLGHVEAASGIAQLTKVVQQLKNRQIAPLLHLGSANPHIDFEGSPFYLATELQEWKRPILEVDGCTREFPRRAAINTFGGGGSLAHLIVEEYAPELYGEAVAPAAPELPGKQLVLVSAKTAERLRAAVVRLLEFVEGNETASLEDIAYTLQVGREAMAHRGALIVEDRAQLVAVLRAFLAASQDATRYEEQSLLFAGHDGAGIESPARPLEKLLSQRALPELARWWVQGGEADWRSLHAQRRQHVAALPTYPFERRRCWLKEAASTLYADSFVNQKQADLEVSDDEAIDRSVYRAVGSMLGLAPEELEPDASLARYEMLSVLLPRLREHIEKRTSIRIAPELMEGCETPRDIVKAAMHLPTIG